MNLDKPLVSISVVTYNHKNFIKQCLDGILMQQTNFAFEILLGEDESTDGTREICVTYAKKHPDKIKLFLRSRKDVIYINGNPTGRFNFMENLKAAKGKYIALCEGDDYWTDPLKLQKQVDFLEANKEFAICFHKVKLFKQNENCFKKDTITRKIPNISTIEELALGNFIHTPSVMIKNNFKIPQWFSKLPTGDWALYMIAIKDKKIKKLNDIMAVYRVHDSGIWSDKTKEYRIKNTLKCYKIMYDSAIFSKETKSILYNKIAYFENHLNNSSSKISIFFKIKKYFTRLKLKINSFN